ncbi:P-loop containing nucleoside triphosphate hydrolase protein [Apiosordaria backusii]|uniref:P-loop containing nucleoside triphosphate hydrolase protein n=1 Tax=Apiosordaria backusii TaxID=314023 RepID=A0AA40BKE1_9PEZI|nr:P-loop containing nucleoside triphosphate hydrolase protein [Apiosordaria backusii]
MKRILKTALRFKESPKDPIPSFHQWPSRTFSTTTTRLAEAAPPPIQLRAYQEECIQAVLTSISQGHKRLGISLATGSGKTVIFTRLIDRVKPPNEEATRSLILAHRRELVEQAARHCATAYPGKTIEVELGKIQATGHADITVASLQSILSKDRLLKFDPSKFKLVLVDEAHHIVAPGYLKVLEHMNLRQKHPDSPTLVGVSATFSRSDGLRLGAAIDEIVYHKDYVDMIKDKWLSDVVFTTVESKADLSKVKTKGAGGTGEFDTASLSKAVNTPELNDIIIRAWFAKAAPPKRDSTLVFCVDLSHVAALTQRFRHHGIDARYVTGDTPAKERAETLEQFKRKEFPVLINCGVFTEGTDIPNIDCVVLARPTRSRNLLIQMIGRGMRLHEGKENCHVIDMVSSLDTGIVTTPTLFGLDPGELVAEQSGQELYKIRERREESEREKTKERGMKMAEAANAAKPTGRSYKVAFTEYDSVFDLISDTSGEKHIRSVSQFTWVQVNPSKYVLSTERDVIKLEREEVDVSEEEGEENSETIWRGYVMKALPPGMSKSPWATPRELLKARTFVDAVHGCDTFVMEHYSQFYIAQKMPWRKAPASEGQLKFLNKLRTKEDELGPGDITRGKAADMITKIKHGAKGRFAELEADKKRRNKKSMYEQLERERREREKVSVGPLAS